MAGWLQVVVIVAVVGLLHVPLGDYMARVYASPRHWRAEAAMYRVCGIDPDQDQRWWQYARSLLAFSAVGVLLLYLVLRLQGSLPFAVGHAAVAPALAFNTAVSFTTNTSWQNYPGEGTLGHLAQAAGLGVEAFASAAVGMAAAVALIRGFVRRRSDGIGNFWTDLVRGTVRILIPLSLVFGVLLAGLGVIQNLDAPHAVATLTGGRQAIPGGPVASWEPIKLMSGDGGGFFNANSAHPFENPTPLTNAVEIVLMLLIPTAFIRTFARMTEDRRNGWALFTVAAVLFAAGLAVLAAAQFAHHDPASMAAGTASEGTETRFGVAGSVPFGAAATASADGAANASYDSFSSLGGGVLMANMMLGEVSPGGAGSGLYGLLMTTLIAVFLGGLMVGRTPEYLRKGVRSREMKLVGLYYLTTPAVILVGVGLAVALPAGRSATGNPGPHGFSEIVYAFTSAANSNGSAFAGLSGNTTFYNTLLALAMLIGRYLPMIFVLALAGSLARQRAGVMTSGTLRPHGALFVALVTGTALLVTALTFFPALALGPLAEGLH